MSEVVRGSLFAVIVVVYVWAAIKTGTIAEDLGRSGFWWNLFGLCVPGVSLAIISGLRRRAEQRIARTDATRGRIQAMLIVSEAYLPRDLLPHLQELIDHDEWGLALDWMLDALLEEGRTLPLDVVEEYEASRGCFYPGERIDERLSALRGLSSSTSSSAT